MAKNDEICKCGEARSDKSHQSSLHPQWHLFSEASGAKFALPVRDYAPAHESWQRQREIKGAIEVAEATIRKDGAKLRWVEKHEVTRADKMAKIEQRIMAEREHIALWAQELELLDAADKAGDNERSEKLFQEWVVLASAVVETAFPNDAVAKVEPSGYVSWVVASEYGDIQIQHRGQGGFGVELLTGEMQEATDRETGERFTYPKTAFGYEARVTGARQDKWNDASSVLPAEIGWGSYSGMKTPEQGRTMMKVYSIAISLAEAENELLGL